MPHWTRKLLYKSGEVFSCLMEVKKQSNQMVPYKIYSFTMMIFQAMPKFWDHWPAATAIKARKEWASESLLIPGRSISRPTSSRSLKPSMSGMWTLLITRSNWSFFSLSSSGQWLPVPLLSLRHHKFGQFSACIAVYKSKPPRRNTLYMWNHSTPRKVSENDFFLTLNKTRPRWRSEMDSQKLQDTQVYRNRAAGGWKSFGR